MLKKQTFGNFTNTVDYKNEAQEPMRKIGSGMVTSQN